jgi:hypothetical protein
MASAVHDIAPMERDGLICTFGSLGSRLDFKVKNQTKQDFILDYSLLTLTSGELILKLNGSGGKYTDMDKPKSASLIPAGTTHSEELIPVKAVEFVAGAWQEYWLVHVALTAAEPTLFIPFSLHGKAQLEKIPLEVAVSKLEVTAKVEGQK